MKPAAIESVPNCKQPDGRMSFSLSPNFVREIYLIHEKKSRYDSDQLKYFVLQYRRVGSWHCRKL